jgi:hypothetical protein
LLFV